MIGIGITSFNRNRLVLTTIERIKQFTKVPFKLVIIDDGSKVPLANATYRFRTNQGSPIAKNKCLELLDDCEHIFLFDDDTYPIKEGWHDAYVNAGVKHLNYTFKYPYEVVNGVRHLQNPNGCMMYIHNDVLKAIGGFDTGFVKYGYWHGAFSNRVYNYGLTPDPFVDIINSHEFIYCLDQKPQTHRTATQDRGKYLAANKRRYFEKIDSFEFIPYKQVNTYNVHYSNPYSTSKNIGKALNDFCEMIPDGDWICLQDGDITYLTPSWGKQVEDALKKYGDTFGLIGCVTNRLGRPIQLIEGMFDNHNMLDNKDKAFELEKKHYALIEDITDKKYIAGMFMLFPKKVWNECKFPENNIAFDDAFSNLVRKKGYKLGLMKGLYVYHLYRAWSDNPIKDRAHLK